MEYDDDVLGFFLDEVEDVLDEWERICLDIKNGKDGDMQALFRCAHNLKGSSKSVGLDDFGDFVHKIEDLIGAIVHGSIELNEGIADSLLTGQSLMSKWVEELKND